MRFIALLFIALQASGATWYVSSTGVGDGTLGSPGGLSNAVTPVGWATNIVAGDTVYLRGGTYEQGTNLWQFGIDGTVGNLITWRAYTGESPKIDGPLRFGSNKHHRFWGIEFFDSHKNEWAGLTNPWLHIDNSGSATSYFEWINCVFHDVHNCFSGTTGGALVRGCIFWYVGQTAAEHVVYPYCQNVTGNIGTWTSGEFIESGTTNIIVRSNIFFGEGVTIANNSGSEVVIGYPSTVEHNSFCEQKYETIGLWFNAGSAGVTCVSNVIAAPFYPFKVEEAWGLITFPSNDVSSYTAYPTNSLDLVKVYKNDDESRRAHIAVFNWASNDTVSVSLSGVLSAGDTYQLISAQNYAAGAIQTGAYNGTSISVPMTNLTVASVLYGTNVAGTVTSPRFAAFVLLGQAPAMRSFPFRVTRNNQ